jgi:hypothetical protein
LFNFQVPECQDPILSDGCRLAFGYNIPAGNGAKACQQLTLGEGLG